VVRCTPSVSPNVSRTTKFLMASRWSHGSNRLQMDADSKLLTEFLSVLQADNARLAHEVSSLGHAQATSMNSSRCTSFSYVCKWLNFFIFSLCVAPKKSQCPTQTVGGKRTSQTLCVVKSDERLKTWGGLFHQPRKVYDGCKFLFGPFFVMG
jgi:hypothetical protein